MVCILLGLILLSQDLKKVSTGGESTVFGASKTAEVKPVSNIAVKRNAEEELAGGKETAN